MRTRNTPASLLAAAAASRPRPAWAAAARRLLLAPLRALAWAWLVPGLLLLLWWLAAREAWVPPQVLPPPAEVAASLQGLVASGELWPHTLISVQRVALGFAAGAGLGLLLGAAMGLSPLARDYLHPSFKALAQVPVLGWLPLLMLLVGIDEALKWLLIAKAALVPVALNTMQGLQSVPSRYIELARVLGYTRWQRLSRVLFPAALAPIWTGLRYGLTHAWLALVVVELLASSEGLGFLIIYGRQLFQLELVMAAVIVVGAFGWALDRLLAAIEARLLRWRREAF